MLLKDLRWTFEYDKPLDLFGRIIMVRDDGSFISTGCTWNFFESWLVENWADLDLERIFFVEV